MSHDVVIIGAGCAGLCTAIAARQRGLSALVLEAAPLLGGGTANASGYLWVGANPFSNEDTPEATRAYLRFVAGGEQDEARLEAYAAEAPRALAAMQAAGVPFRLSPRIDHYGIAPGAMRGGRILDTPPFDTALLGDWAARLATPPGLLWRLGGSELVKLGGANSPAAWAEAERLAREAPTMRGQGAGLFCWLLATALALGAEVRVASPARALLAEAGRVTGVVSTETHRAARGVVLASGGYESSAELVQRFEGLPGWMSMFPASLDGSGLTMAQEIGAAVHVVGNNLSIFLGFDNRDEAPGLCRLSGTQELVAPHGVVVNRDGRRFADESFFQAVAPSLRAFDPRRGARPNLPCFLIFDAQYAAGLSFAGRPPGAPIPDWVARAETPEALAAQLGIDGEGLGATLARFNADAREGRDSEFQRGNTPWGLTHIAPSATLGTVERAPFFGVPLHPTALASAGLLADARARVRHVRGHAIPGLYAVGNAAARTETGAGYQTGYSLASGMTFGWLAANDLAG